jgi:hypothetical protein
VEHIVFIFGFGYGNTGQWEVPSVRKSGTVLAGLSGGVHGIDFHGVLCRNGSFVILHIEISSLVIQNN